jgi:hypothetical protein
MTIERKCNEAGCQPAARTRHALLWSEKWDVHPPDEFRQWWPKHREAQACGVITAWNTDRNRQEFNRWQKSEPDDF